VQVVVDLVVHRAHDRLGVVAEVLAGDPAGEVEQLVPVGVPQRRALGARDDEVGGRDAARHEPLTRLADGRRAVQLLGLHGASLLRALAPRQPADEDFGSRPGG
jgi:hypothetical protein